MDRYTKGFVFASLVYFFLAAVLGIVMGGADAPGWVRFAHVHFNLLGFMSMMIYGVGYFILPRFNGKTLRWPSLLPVHFWLSNVGLVGMVAAAPDRPSAPFVVFAALNVVSVAVFVTNLGATMLLEPVKGADEEDAGARNTGASLPAPALGRPWPSEAGAPAGTAGSVGKAAAAAAPPPALRRPIVEISPDMRVGEILTRWPETAEVFVDSGFASLGDPGHRDQVKQLPVTLRMACQRHNVDLDEMVARLVAFVEGTLAMAGAGAPAPAAGGRARKGTVEKGKPIGADDVLGDILAVYPETEEVFRRYYGAACFSCPGQTTESVRQSAMMHNVPEKRILGELNQAAGF